MLVIRNCYVDYVFAKKIRRRNLERQWNLFWVWRELVLTFL